MKAGIEAAETEIVRLHTALAETQALEMQHGAVVERLRNQQQNGSPVVEGMIQHQAMEIARMRHRIECLRGALKTASGWVWEGAATEVEANERANTLLALAGDMEPPLNVELRGGPAASSPERPA